MIEYGEGDPNNGEVFDLTALAAEMHADGKIYSAELGLRVEVKREYSFELKAQATKSTISFNGQCSPGEWVHRASHLDDVVNAAMPDGDAVQAIKKRAARLSKKVDDLRHDAMRAKLEQVARIRHVNPIARVTSAPIAALTE
jgi:hypothetical protein